MVESVMATTLPSSVKMPPPASMAALRLMVLFTTVSALLLKLKIPPPALD
jgi:hypothetical protein